MKLKLEKDIKVAVEINGVNYINMDNGQLFQNIDDEDNQILFYIKSSTEQKEIKIKLVKEKTVE